MDIFEIKDLTFTYPGHREPALDHVSFSVQKGSVTALCGSSGSGKTTMMRLLKPALSPHGRKTGEIVYHGGDRQIEVGFVLQNPENQIVTDKVWHELAFGPENLGWENEMIRVRVAEMASYFGIQNWFKKEVNDLSGGEKQILNLAAVMVMNPKVLLLDEPTSQLDPIAAEDFLETIRKLNREIGTTVIITEHRLDSVLPEADRMLVLDRGKLIVDDTPAEGAARLAESGHSMFSSMPAVTKAFALVSRSGIKQDENAPLDIRQGRKWLEDLMDGRFVTQRRIPDAEGDRKAETVLSLKNIWFRYEKNSEDVLTGLSLEVKQGETFAVVGGNGSGKSTLLKILCGMEKAYRGRMKTEKQKILMLPQDPQSVFACETVGEELSEMSDDEEKVSHIAKLLGISALMHSHPYDISGGEQQKTVLAKMLLKDPDILLMDEPTKGLDNAFKEHIGKILDELKKKGKTIILVSHDIEFCAGFADRCAMMFDGSLTASGTARKLFSGNRFYTTAVSKMSGDFFENAIVPEDIAELLFENGKEGRH